MKVQTHLLATIAVGIAALSITACNGEKEPAASEDIATKTDSLPTFANDSTSIDSTGITGCGLEIADSTAGSISIEGYSCPACGMG